VYYGKKVGTSARMNGCERENSKKGKRPGKMIDRVGLEACRQAVGIASHKNEGSGNNP
jgi:hypothetical protein